ncbi:MAG: MFS transporter [Elusimicrobia bacterium]|nr:MFS transporter [Elusimicrobiota bacterium]
MPILLVKRGVTTAQGAFVLSTLKATILAGTLAGGALSDRFPSRTLVLCALLMSALGLGSLPFQNSIALILAFGITAQLAEALLNVAQRTLLMGQVEPGHQKEALGWLRMAHNLAQVFSYSIASAASRLGVMPLMLFDSATSLGAFILGRRILPRDPAGSAERSFGRADGAPTSKTAFFGLAAVLLGWMFFYELFLEGGAGRLEILHPGEGLRRFASMMILNTILCAALSVRASRFFERSLSSIAGGMVLTAAGILIASWGMASQLWVFTGMLFITTGELMLGAVAQYTLMRLTPGHKNAGFYYSMGLTLMQCGRIMGATLAFPLLIHAESLLPFSALIAGSLAALLAVLFALRGEIARLG